MERSSPRAALHRKVSEPGSSMLAQSERLWLLACIVGIALVFHLWGIRRDFPYITGEDPTLSIYPAIRVASTGNLNPGRFNHPASTLIYPLAAIYHTWNAAALGGSWLAVDPQLRGTFDAHPEGFYLLARLFVVLYVLLGLVAVYQVGRRVLGERAALLAALFTALYPTELFSKQARTESAALFFSWLAVWCCLRLYDRPTLRNQVLAGASIGLAISTKYYAAPLIAVLATVDAMILLRRIPSRLEMGPSMLGIGAGLLAVPLTFALTTPYFFLDYATAASNIQLVNGSAELGVDHLPPIQNLLWYLGSSLPRSICWPQVVAALVGLILVLSKPTLPRLLPLVFAAAFFVPLSLHPWHFDRWLIPILPAFALLAAHALDRTIEFLANRLRLPRLATYGIAAAGIAVLIATPVEQVVALDRQCAHLSTYVVARQWAQQNLPRGSAVAFEWETLPMPLARQKIGTGTWVNHDGGCEFIELYMSKLSVRGTPDYYPRNGYPYLVTSSFMYAVYPDHPDLYPKEAAFYRTLMARGRLLHEVTPSSVNPGPGIRIYELH